MTGWPELRLDLKQIVDEYPRALQAYPDPEGPRHEERVSVHLAASAEELARGLHNKYGDYVDLTLGAFGYPERSRRRYRVPNLPKEPAGTLGIAVAAGTPLQVRSGESTSGEVSASNTGPVTRELHTAGLLTSYVVDEHGHVVGGYVGALPARLVRFTIEPSKTTRVPVLLGAAALDPAIGYAVPPGSWQVVIELQTTAGQAVCPALPLTIT